MIALIDSGINPYHEVFAAPPGFADMSATVPNASMVALTDSGSYEARIHADSSLWAHIQPKKLYGFNGTRILAIDFSGSADKLLDIDKHGTATAGLAAASDPTAIIVMIKANGSICPPDPSCLLSPTLAEGMRWAAEQPWIDVISVSAGIPGDIYDPSAIHPEAKAFLDASRAAAQAGKLVVIGTGNTEAPSITSYMAAPPWIICVGGVEPSTHGETTHQNKMVDVVSNNTMEVASSTNTSSFNINSGTSFATPIVAGTLSRAIHDARAKVGQTHGIEAGFILNSLLPNGSLVRATSGDFRSALNATARQWNATDWQPTNGPSPDPQYNIVVALTDPIVFGPAQIGWGYVEARQATEIAGRVLSNDYAGVSATTAVYMAQYQALREQAWP